MLVISTVIKEAIRAKQLDRNYLLTIKVMIKKSHTMKLYKIHIVLLYNSNERCSNAFISLKFICCLNIRIDLQILNFAFSHEIEEY